MPYVTIEEEVWVDLDDFDTDDLVEELKRRKGVGSTVYSEANSSDIINDIYMAKHVRNQPYDHLVDQLLSVALGKII
jgi:hypothetical protein